MRAFLLLMATLSSAVLHASSQSATTLATAPFNGFFLAKTALFGGIVVGFCLFVGSRISRYARLPEVASYIIAGALLGPSGLDILSWDLFAHPFVADVPAIDYIISFFNLISAFFAVPLLMWMAGHETDMRHIRNVSIIACIAGLLGALLPLAMMALGLQLFGLSVVQAAAVGLVFAATSVSLPVALFASLGKMQTRPAQATLGAAVVDDIAAVLALSIFTALFSSGTTTSGSISLVVARMIMSLGVMMWVGLFVLPRLYMKVRHNKQLIIACGFVSMWAMGAWAELMGGLAGITGAYFAGYFHKQNDTEHTLVSAIEPLVTSVFLPLYLSLVGLSINLATVKLDQLGLFAAILILATVSKLLAGAISTALSNRLTLSRWTFLETALFSISLIPRGEVGLVIASIMLNLGLISQAIYAVCVLAVVATTILSPILLQAVYSIEKNPAYGPAVQAGIDPSSVADQPVVKASELLFDAAQKTEAHSANNEAVTSLNQAYRKPLLKDHEP